FIKHITAFTLIVFAVFSRLAPHPPNFSPITAIALFSGVYLDRKFAFTVPIIAMIISDYFIGYHSLLWLVYLCFIAIAFLGLYLKKRKTFVRIAISALASSVIFFIVTNFGVWASGYYGLTLSGLYECYVMAIPFFRNTLSGDILYTGVMFGCYEIMNYFLNKYGEESIVAREKK
ncbi:MAG TPA: DUF6580 family putative transport protein, partial [Ignavibacteria bacterium]|nr:DUF6580 family putative transport protein [Ignavibacteria bacterium]